MKSEPERVDYANLARLQTLLGLHRDKVSRHINKAGLKPLPGTKKYNVREVAAAIIEHRKQDNNSPNEETQEQRNRLLRAKADLEEIKVKKRIGQVVEVDLVCDEFEKFLSVIQQSLRAVPSKLATRIGRKESQLVKEELDATLNELSEYNPVTGKPGARQTTRGPSKGRPKVKAARKSDRDRVGKPKTKVVKRG